MQTHLTLWLSCVAGHLIKTHLTRFTAACLCVLVRTTPCRLAGLVTSYPWGYEQKQSLSWSETRSSVTVQRQESGYWYQGLIPKQHRRGKFCKVSHCRRGYIGEHYTKCTGGETDLLVSQRGKGVSSLVRGKPHSRQWDHSKCKRSATQN